MISVKLDDSVPFMTALRRSGDRLTNERAEEKGAFDVFFAGEYGYSTDLPGLQLIATLAPLDDRFL